ncbi:hypothetical protein RJ639_033278 [Escallonia herrerae]|uniref:FAS1 domain-containing protein n=1 Tax=Escallonia herrerae TaxID=1293975 RepID=A0AA88WTU5_9ASTE|nr:hypothetical protein RJ639_033278 [Escallonia herrerae]
MSALLSKGLTVYSIKNVLSLHVFADYFGAKKLHQITKGSTLTATMFQATGEAPGTSGYVNITDLKGGRVGFSAEDSDGSLSAVYVKSLLEMPYNISVIQISHILSSPEAEAPASAPTGKNVTGLMTQKDCKAFADLLISSGADVTFIQNSDGGLTVFCPTDTVVTAFMPKYKNLTAAGKASLLLYHGVPVYQSMGMLRSNNGLMNTLATEGPNKYDFTIQNDGEDVKLETKAATAKIVATLIDAEPLAIYKIDKVLLPRELFKPAPSAHAPKGEAAAADAPGPASDDEDPADQTASDSNGVVRIGGGRSVVSVVFGFCIGGVLAFV